MRELSQREIGLVQGGLLGIVGIPAMVGLVGGVAMVGMGLSAFSFNWLLGITGIAQGGAIAMICGAGVLVSLVVPVL